MYQVIENVGYLAKYPACLYKPRPHRQIIKLQNYCQIKMHSYEIAKLLNCKSIKLPYYETAQLWNYQIIQLHNYEIAKLLNHQTF